MGRKNALLQFGNVVLKCYANTLFSDKLFPAFLFLAASFYDPYIGLMGLLGNIAVNGFAYLLHTDKNYIHAGVFGINGILVGISIGLYVPFVEEALVVLVIGCMLTAIVAISLLSSLTKKRQLPILSIPFVVTTWTILLTLKVIHGEMPKAYYMPLEAIQWLNELTFQAFPVWLSSYFKAFSSTLFQPSVYSGVLVLAGIFLTSRISFLSGIIGGAVGMALFSWIGGEVNSTQPFSSSLNYIIVAIGLGGFFLAPTVGGFIYTIGGVAATVLVVNGMEAALQPLGLPVLVAPFNLVMMMMMFPLKSEVLYTSRAGLYLVPLPNIRTPEAHRAWYIEHHGKRGKVQYRLPFYGTWFVYQGEFGHHTHKGTQAYAYDFIVVDNETKQCRNFGIALEDYYTFGLPVLAPADGKVIAVVNYIKDNLPGITNEVHNWGNYVIIQHSETEFTEISHFKEGSIIVSIGELIRCGQVLGLCGNSGYSPVPHLHIQRQKGPFLAAETVPMKFSDVRVEHNGETAIHPLIAPLQGAMVTNE
ncbi:MAG: hypothetical protein EPO24_00250 [Bacteroidetes bacterium]|nr:MAG: hypothetical protein EPO24_00250 [Bacteroidota bacterium]